MHRTLRERAMAMALAVAMMAGHIPMNTFAEDQTAQAAEDDGAAAEEAARAAAAAELAAAEEVARAAEEAARAAAEAELAAAQEAARAAAEAAAAEQAQEQAMAAQGGSETVWIGPEESINEEESVEEGETPEGSLTMVQYDPSGLIEDADTASKIEYDVTFVVNDLDHVKIYLPDPKSDDPEKRLDVIEAAKDEELEEKKIKIAAGEDEQIFYVVPEEGYVVDEVKTVRERDGRKESTDAETIEEKDGYIVRYLVDDSTSIEITVVSEAADEAPASDEDEGLVTIDDYETPLGLAPAEPEAPAAPAQEEQEAAEAPEVRRNLVTFEIPEGISLLVYGELAGGNTAYAEDGCIRFGLFAEEGYEISSVLVDHEKEARKTEDGSEYIIEGIQTDETIVSVTVQAPETEPETEAPAEEPQTEALTEAAEKPQTEALTEAAEEETEAPRENVVTFEADEGVNVLVDGEPIEEGKAIAKDGAILFTLQAEENTQIISVMVDNEIEARQTENENEYIIEGIQTDETIVTITAETTAPEMPEQVIGPLALADGTQVTFYVPEGSLPEGTKAKVIQIDTSGMMDEIRSKANNSDLKQECVAAYSFVFYTETEAAEEETEAGETQETIVEPQKALTVQVENPEPETAQDVYYLN